MGGARAYPGIWTILDSLMQPFEWNSTWAMTDDVSQEHKDRQEFSAFSPGNAFCTVLVFVVVMVHTP